MSCGECHGPALYLCKCSNFKLCASCFDPHCLTSGSHQLLLLDEAEKTYTADELLSDRSLLIAKLDQELVRLEGFRRNVRQIAEELRSSFRETIHRKAEQWKDSYKPQFEGQIRDLKVACEDIRTRKMIESLPSGRFPWTKLGGKVPDTVIELPGEIGDIDFSMNSQIETGIEWDFSCHELEQEAQKEEGKQIHSDRYKHVPSLEQRNTEASEESGSDKDDFELLIKDRKLRERWLLSKFDQGGFPRLLPSVRSPSELQSLSSLSVSYSLSPIDYSSLSLLILCAGSLSSFSLSSCSPKVEEFSLLTRTFRHTKLATISLPRNKLSTAQVKELLLALSSTVQEVDLSYNYFEVQPRELSTAVGLKKLIIKDVPLPGNWLEEMLQVNPQIEVVLNDCLPSPSTC